MRAGMQTGTQQGQTLRKGIRESIEVKQRILEDAALLDTIAEAARLMAEALGRGRKILLFGNGGSAADAQHIAAELVGRYVLERRALPALALSTNASAVTAIGNDYGYDQVFARQVEALGQEGDVAVGLSTSGASANVVKGLERARAGGLLTVAFTGEKPGAVGAASDLCLRVPSPATARIQESHILLGHLICELIESQLFCDR
jgi:D-sedoheptulose 7-phosphate isomerase